MEVQQCIQSRRTIRKYTSEPVGPDQIHLIIEGGKYAPSAGNLQNWFFVVVNDEGKISALADASVQQVWMENSSVLIVVASDLQKAENFYGDRGVDVYSRQNTAAAVQNMLLVAHDIGLGAAWVGAFDEDMVSRTLGLPGHVRPEAIVVLGYPDEKVPIPPRFEFSSIVWFNSWGSRFIDKLLSLGKTSHLVKKYVGKTGKIIEDIIGKK
ncbi:MAG: nitroreductase family protein [Candidatus Nanoarchaeia archaeon]